MNRIALVSFKYPPVYSGYGKQLESVTKDILNKSNEFEIKVLTAYQESQLSKTPNYEVISLLESTDDNNSKTVFPFSREVFKWLVSNRKQYDIIHCVKAGPEAMACNLASKILGKKLIVKVAQDELSEREISSAKGLKKSTRLLRRRLLRSADIFIAISEEIEGNIRKNSAKSSKIVRIPNGVNTETFKPADMNEKISIRKKLAFDAEETILLYTGAINRRKGVHDLLDGLELYSSESHLKVVLCGPVLEDLNFDDRISKLNSKPNLSIDYRGKVTNVQDYMKAADAFILPSYSEGLPNVLLEACSSGLPAIATNIGGSRDIIENGKNGYLVETSQPVEIKDKITALAEDKELRLSMGANARQTIEKSFALNKVSDAYMKLYDAVCEY